VTDYALCVLDPQGSVSSWNAGAARQTGFAAEDILGRHFRTLFPPDAVAQAVPEQLLARAADQGHVEDEGWRVRKDGSLFWANVIITALRAPDGAVCAFVTITRDLTEHMQAEEAGRQSEERFRLMVEGVVDYAIYMLDPEGHVMSWNVGAERMKGYSADEIIGQHFSRFYPPEDVARDKPGRQLRIVRDQGRVEDEGWRVRKDGSRFWANVIITALFDKKGRLRGFAKVTRDLTERKQAEALRLADRHKNAFLAMLAHELRNPLAPVRNGLQILNMNGITPDVARQVRGMMERQVQHLARLVDDLLDVSRLLSDKVELLKETVDVADLCRQAAETVQPSAAAKGQDLRVTLPASPLRVDGDLIRLAQMLSNLMSNASKYTDKGGRIWLSAEREGDEAVLRVRDTGAGMDAELLPHVFDLFVQADASLARTQGGLGVGLTLVKKVAELHGGSVLATSPGPGLGSEFVVRLPAVPEPKPDPADARPAPPAGRAGAARRVLVVDDIKDVADSTAMYLRIAGHQVEVAYDGQTALDVAAAFRPDVVLLDIGLPGMSGYDVAKQLRSRPGGRELAIVAITGYGRDEDRRRAEEAGFDHHFIKPVDPADVQALLSR
jgi:PAS domain S-box-containing protein